MAREALRGASAVPCARPIQRRCVLGTDAFGGKDLLDLTLFLAEQVVSAFFRPARLTIPIP